MSATTGRSRSASPIPVPAEAAVIRTLYRISSLAGRFDDPAEAMPEIVAALQDLFRADSVVLALVDPDTGALAIEFSRGFPEEHRRATIPPGVGLLGWAALNRKPVVAGDTAYDPRYLPLRPRTRSMLVAPIEIDGHLHGLFAIESDQPRAYGPDHLQVLVSVTSEAAVTMQRLWLLEHLRRKAGQLEVLGKVAQEVAGKLRADELMETVTRESHRLTGCRLAVLQLFDAPQHRVRLQAIFPPGEYYAGNAREWPVEESVAGAAISTRRQVELTNVQQPEYLDLSDVPVQPALVSLLATPLIAEDRVTGVLSVFTERPHRFSNDERRLLATLANLAAVAWQNAQLYQRAFESEESLRQSERLTTLGLLAAEIAHETRNPLTVIRLLFGALDLHFPAGDPRANDVAIIREKLDQLEAFVSRVLTVAKAPESLHARWLVDDLIRETCQLLRLKLNQARIHLHYEPPPSPWAIDGNKAQIQQVLLNVILNAVQVMPEGGSIAISCGCQRGAVRDDVLIDVRDTGPGIPKDMEEKIFESFLSGRAGGTGLGLAIAKRIMRSHHGDIAVGATGPGGTTMRISLPLAQ